MNKYAIAFALACLPATTLVWQGGMAALGITEAEWHTQVERAARPADGGLSLPGLGTKHLAAIRALSEPQQAALMREFATATKAIMSSQAFQSAHDAYIASKYKAVNHGLKVQSLEKSSARAAAGNTSDLELEMKRQMSAMYVEMAMDLPLDTVKMMFDESLKEWTRYANNPKRSDRAKYAALVKKAQATEPLSASDPVKFRRGYAVLRSAEAGGLDTEEALFGAQASVEKEKEQLMWDQHNLRGALKRGLAQIVAEAPTVDFAAETEQKDGSRVFVKAAYEKKSLTWKAMYRAGKGPTAAGLEIAKAWLKEL